MPVRKSRNACFSLTTSKPFESVVSALTDDIGQLDLAAFASASKSSGTSAELEEVINTGKHGGNRFDVVPGIRSRCRCSEGKQGSRNRR